MGSARMRVPMSAASIGEHVVAGGGHLTVKQGELVADVIVRRLRGIGGPIEPDDECPRLEVRVRFRDASGAGFDHGLVLDPQQLVQFPAGAPAYLIAEGPAPDDPFAVADAERELVATRDGAEPGVAGRIFVVTTVRFSRGSVVPVGSTSYEAQHTEAAGRFWLSLREGTATLDVVAEVSGLGDLSGTSNGEVTFGRRVPIADLLWRSAATIAGRIEGDVLPSSLVKRGGAICLDRTDGSSGAGSMPLSSCVRVTLPG